MPSSPAVRPLTLQEARAVYQQHLTRDFQRSERKPWSRIEDALGRGRYLCLGLFCQDALAGYAFFASLPDETEGRNYLLDYFAVLPALRGRGLGSDFLRRMLPLIPDARCILCEAENPDYAEDAAEKARQESRLRFYRRSGVADTGVTARVYGVEYRILLFPGAEKSSAEIRGLYEAFYHSFFPPAVYRQQVLIR